MRQLSCKKDRLDLALLARFPVGYRHLAYPTRREGHRRACVEDSRATPWQAASAKDAWETKMTETRPPVPPFTPETAAQKVRGAEDGWNARDPARVSLAYTVDSQWRNRAEFIQGRAAIAAFLKRKWAGELDYRLIKELWAFTGNRIAVRFAYEWHDDSGNWFRSYGNENWEFDDSGLMRRRIASINDLPIAVAERKYHWDAPGPRPPGHPGLSDLGL